jgi:nucleoside-diphosphate-sugar epimerase
MTQTRVPPVLVTGATGRVGRAVVDLLIDAGVPVRALTHRSEAAAALPANVEVVTGDLTGNLRAACRLSLLTAPNPAPFLPATESNGRAARRY